jgi:hypothetical protein
MVPSISQDDPFNHTMITSKIIIPTHPVKLPSIISELFPPYHRMIPSDTG